MQQRMKQMGSPMTKGAGHRVFALYWKAATVLSIGMLWSGTTGAALLSWDPDLVDDANFGGGGTWQSLQANAGAPANWNDGAGGMQQWDNTAGDTAVFGGTAGEVGYAEVLVADGLRFNTPGYIVRRASGGGRGIDIGAGGIIDNTGGTTILSRDSSDKIRLTASQQWDIDGGTTLDVRGLYDGNGNTLTKTGTGTLLLSTTTGGTAAASTMNINEGRVHVSGENASWTIDFTVGDGLGGAESDVLRINPAASAGLLSNFDVTVASSGRVEVANGAHEVRGGILTVNAGGVMHLEPGSNIRFLGGASNINGGTLSGSGTIRPSNELQVATGSTVAPGQASAGGILTINDDSGGGIQFTGTSTLEIDIFGAGGVAGTDYDQLAVEDVLLGLSNVDLLVNFTDKGLDLSAQTLTVATTLSDLTGQSFSSVSFSYPSASATVTYGNGFITLSDIVIPEPGTVTIFGMAALLIVRRRRKN